MIRGGMRPGGNRKIRIRAGLRNRRCLKCGFVYSPLKPPFGEGIPAGRRFEDLPDHWVCPKCGAPKSSFVKLAADTNDSK